ncbi:hypothetical protein GCM10010954_32550 [Halobacillus andaensis]|uniref:Uncharacterized protein n=1 Tax=Halobacillus andaensis TaxID=1176239 RepID=A0A917B9N5_HALAA|nr:hypothetical protein [Halobacillus andaensis]MBP2005360.1 hypothetical protein [Halobacillus andaensis]GGF30876.1 hypothetical protein GCM10010954_32550 [Halobacillus andaensis]
MTTVVLFSIITILSVVFALKRKRPLFLALPVVSLMGFALVKIVMVPMPFWDTVRFIFNLRG